MSSLLAPLTTDGPRTRAVFDQMQVDAVPGQPPKNLAMWRQKIRDARYLDWADEQKQKKK